MKETQNTKDKQFKPYINLLNLRPYKAYPYKLTRDQAKENPFTLTPTPAARKCISFLTSYQPFRIIFHAYF